MNNQPLLTSSHITHNITSNRASNHTAQQNRRGQHFGLFASLMLVALLFSGCVPRLLGMQGRLLDGDGNPVTGQVDIVVNYWTCEAGDEAASGCDNVYSQTKNNVPVVNGLFDLEIGTASLDADVGPDPLLFGRPLYAEIIVEGETLTPRQRLLGAPYAMSLVGGAVIGSFHQGAGGDDGTDENYATLSIAAGGAKGTALLITTNSNTPSGDIIRGCNSALATPTRECGDLRFRVTSVGNVTADGAFTGGGADFAEYLDATGDRAAYEPGDVLIVSPDQDRAVALATEAYSTAVIGVYSTDPAMLGGGRYLNDNGETDMLPVGIVGIVPVKVSAENGPIHRGDLLTTSNTPGHAMLADEYLPGAMIGKAMGELEEGTGVIEVVLLLQ